MIKLCFMVTEKYLHCNTPSNLSDIKVSLNHVEWINKCALKCSHNTLYTCIIVLTPAFYFSAVKYYYCTQVSLWCRTLLFFFSFASLYFTLQGVEAIDFITVVTVTNPLFSIFLNM